MNFDLLTAVLKSELPCAKRMILTVVLNHAGQDNRAWPSHPTIAAQAGLAERSVWAHLRDLESAGWIVKVGNVGRVAVWEVTNPANSAGSIPQPLPEIPQILPDAEKTIPQILRDNPANSAGNPANFASLSRNGCELTTQEPHKNQSLTTQEADKPPVVVKVNASKPDWREWNRQKAEKANAVQRPLLAPAEFGSAWTRFCAYRTRRATEARIASEAVEWTRDAAEGAMRSCERHADQCGWSAVVAQIDTAISGGWKGLNFQYAKQPAARPSAAYTPIPLTHQQNLISSWFGRRENEPWSAEETALWQQIQPIHADDWEALEWFYTQATGDKRLCQSLRALLTKWRSEIDRAKNYNPDQK